MQEEVLCLSNLLKNGGNKSKIIDCENNIIDGIEKAVEIKDFYKLPIFEIRKIIKKSDIYSAQTLFKLVKTLSVNKGEEAAMILNDINAIEFDLNQCINIISGLGTCSLCTRIYEIYKEELTLPSIDYQNEIDELKENLRKITGDYPMFDDLVFEPVKRKPTDFIKDIFTATKNGNIKSIQYVFEKGKVDPEITDEDKFTPLHYAAKNGDITIVRYLIEQCRVSACVRNKFNSIPLHYAAENGHLDVVRYLIEKCFQDPKSKGDQGFTPLHLAATEGHINIVKYLSERCYVNIEEKNDYNLSPLHYAVIRNHFDIVKYLIENCKAQVTENDINKARQTDIKVYLKSKYKK